jgi:PAS domain S-box-containing protein
MPLRSAKLFQALVERTPHALWVWEAPTRSIRFVNGGWGRIFGSARPPTEGWEDEFLARVDERDRPEVRQALAERAEGRDPRPLGEFRVQSTRGSCWVRGGLQRIEVVPGECYWAESFLDVTQQREQDVRRALELELRDGLLELFGALVCTCDHEGRIVAVNEALARLCGEKPPSLVGRHVAEVLVGAAEPAAHFRAAVESAGARRRVHVGVRQLRTAGGPTRSVDWWVVVVPSHDGPVRYLALGHDVTEGEQTALALRASEVRFGDLLSHLPGVPWLYTLGERFELIGPAFEGLFGRAPPADKTLGPMLEWFHPEDRRAIERACWEVLCRSEREAEQASWADSLAELADGDAPLQLECRFTRPDGSQRWVLVRGVLVRSPSGRLTQLAGFATDVTPKHDVERALRERTEQLEQLLREKDVLLAEVHHRVKNNLQVIVGLMHLMGAHHDRKRMDESFAELERRVHAMALVHETIYRSANLGAVDMQAYLESLGEVLRMSSGTPAGVTVHVFARGVALDLDTAVRCGLIVNELVSNAFKHAFRADSRGVVAISLSQQDRDRYVLEVADDGVGLPLALDLGSHDTLGLRLVAGLAKQMSGHALRAEPPRNAIVVSFAARPLVITTR